MSDVAAWELVNSPITQAALWRLERIRQWHQRNLATGLFLDDEAQWQAENTLNRLLGHSPSTVGVVNFDVRCNGARAGECWIHVEPEGRTRRASLWELSLPHWSGEGAGELANTLTSAAHHCGASGLEVRAFRGNDASLHLARSGSLFRISSRMIRRLDSTPPLHNDGPTIRLDPMTSDEFAENRDHLVAEYARSLVLAGIFDPDEALADAHRQTSMMLPRGLETASHSWFVVRVGDQRIGTLWLHESRGDASGSVFDIEIAPEFRHQGYGRSVMIEAENYFRRRHRRFLELNVFGYNAVARELYSSIGYEAVEESFIRDAA